MKRNGPFPSRWLRRSCQHGALNLTNKFNNETHKFRVAHSAAIKSRSVSFYHWRLFFLATFFFPPPKIKVELFSRTPMACAVRNGIPARGSETRCRIVGNKESERACVCCCCCCRLRLLWKEIPCFLLRHLFEKQGTHIGLAPPPWRFRTNQIKPD